MTGEQRRDESTSGDDVPTPDEEATPSVGQEDDQPVVRPVPEKIGEGGTNLQDREAALSRRRGREERSP
jgi:hypothetical protein